MDYYSSPALNHSFVRSILSNVPARALFEREHGKKESNEMRVGSLVHCLLFEPHEEIHLFQETTFETLQSKAAKEEWEQIEMSGKMPVKAKDYEKARNMKESLYKNCPEMIELLSVAKKEQPIFFKEKFQDENGEEVLIDCKVKPDFFVEKGDKIFLFDLKTVPSVSKGRISEALASFYDTQAWWYVNGLANVMPGKEIFFAYLQIEREEPHCVAQFVATEALLAHGEKRCRQAIKEYLKYEKEGYPSFVIKEFDEPQWFLNEISLG